MTGRRRALGPANLALLLGLLLVAFWRGHQLIEQGSQPPPPTPRPAPRGIAIVITVEGLGPADATTLSTALETKNWATCTGALSATHPASVLRRAVLHAEVRPLCLDVVSRAHPTPEIPGAVVLHHAEAPEVALELRRVLQSSETAPPAVWLDLQDLSIPPPRLRAARRDLRRQGLTIPRRDVLQRWRSSGASPPEAGRTVLKALHRRGLDELRRGILALLSGGHAWVPAVVVVAAAQSSAGEAAPVLAAVPWDRPPPCPSLEELGALLTGQKTWPMPR